MQIDVVIPTKGEWTLSYCIKAVRRYIPNSHIILVTTPSFRVVADKLGDVTRILDEKNVGKARAEGLKAVESDVYASVDSDVLVTHEWFKWCIKTIKRPDIAACEGYAKTMGKLHGAIQEKWIRNGNPSERFCCLGNTILKTEIVRQAGMPLVSVEEDWQLRRRIEKLGYEWISNVDIKCPHLKTDVDAWKHAVWWGMMGGSVKVSRCIARIPYYLTFGNLERPLNQNLFLTTFQLSLLYGKFKGSVFK